MSLFAMADLHLPLSVNKPMDKFGARWDNYVQKIEKNWNSIVSEKDTVIVPGDISWALTLQECTEDFAFINNLNGKKLLGKGNHDFWWSTLSKNKQFLSENNFNSIDFLYNNAFETENYIVCGSRGWYIDEKLQNVKNDTDYTKIVLRESMRVERSILCGIDLQKGSGKKILVFLHFPPVFNTFICEEIIAVLLKYNIKNCYFGHIHGIYNIPKTFSFRGIDFTLVSADFLNFVPQLVRPV